MRKIVSKFLYEAVGPFVVLVKELWFGMGIKTVKDGLYEISPRPPYVSQLSDAKTKDKEFGHELEDSVAAKRFGAKSLKDFSYWAWRACGIAGVQMVLWATGKNKSQKTIMELIDEGLLLGGYDIENDVGWYHNALAQLARKNGVSSDVKKFVPVSEIAKLVLGGKYVLASMKNTRGGHLLLVYGVRIKSGRVESFVVHDPNNFKQSGEGKVISRKDFEELSTRRVIVFGLESRQSTIFFRLLL